MKIEQHYCDLCDNILKKERHILVIINDKEFSSIGVRSDSDRIAKEICTDCLKILNKLFEYKRKKVNKLKKEITNIYNLGESNG